MYTQAKQAVGKFSARQMIKALTAHNSKLGVNWSVPLAKYVSNKSKIFQTSQYPTYLAKAATAMKGTAFEKWGNYLQSVANRPTIPVVA